MNHVEWALHFGHPSKGSGVRVEASIASDTESVMTSGRCTSSTLITSETSTEAERSERQ